MATIDSVPNTRSGEEPSLSEWNPGLAELLRPLASLKLTVALFAMGIFLVLAGTLAQVKLDIWDVIERYFRCWFSFIEFQVFFPKTWFPQLQNIPFGFWFPGGWTIGGLMTVNLLAAHSLRFKVQAKGPRLLWGLAVTVVGIILTWGVIEFGTPRAGVYETASSDWAHQWTLLCYSLFLPAAGCGYMASRLSADSSKKAQFWAYSVATLAFLGTALFLIAGGESVRLNNSAMRILWQLIQATLAGCVLLAGCLLLFRKRAGIVLLHAGVLLLMANEVVVHTLHEEANMTIVEGETVNFVRDIRSSEMAFVDHTPADKDIQTVIPKDLLEKAAEQGTVISNAELPVDVKVRKFFKNADLKPKAEGDDNPTTFGNGLTHTIVPLQPSSGTDSNADYPAAYVDLIDKSSGKTIQTLLVSALASTVERTDLVPLGEKTYEVSLRFKRNYKPYSIHLIDVRKDDYIGTSTPMNYSSEIRLVDDTRNEDRRIKIWMNNPLRYAGETFYQSNYSKLPRGEVTTLQVVTNEGWMIPYVACMIVAIGMLHQFLLSLLRYLNRAASGQLSRSESGAEELSVPSHGFLMTSLPGFILMLVCGGWMMSLARVPETKPDEFNYYEFGKIPVLYDGRAKPIDTLARNMLRVTSNRETVRTEKSKTESGEEIPAVTLPATQALLELISGSPDAVTRPVLRIDNDELLSTLGLERRKSHRYSLEEIQPGLKNLQNAVDEAQKMQETSPELLSLYQRKVLELHRRLGRLDLITLALIPPRLRLSSDNATEQFMRALNQVNQLDSREPPLLIPPTEISAGPDDEQLKREEWETFAKAYLRDLIYPIAFQAEPNPFSGKFLEIVDAYREQDPAAFNQAVKEYQRLVKENNIPKISWNKLEFETRFNKFSPFFYPTFLYVFAFVLVTFSWLMPRVVSMTNLAAVAVVLVTFIVHSWALYARIAISGRPPVTNLYSSAVFIGWAGVLAGLLIEYVFKRGIGVVLASVFGFASLLIAHGLAGDGDTFTVLQAVLDTQFWLSTHVVCITLGYAATFVAGLLGVISICQRNPLALFGVGLATLAAHGIHVSSEGASSLLSLTPFLLAIPISILPLMFFYKQTQLAISPRLEKDLTRMIYGTLCFALWFSFVGTVLGGLWADDSWGRFWGWDPKENGALIIVLWNALVLHAFWDRQVRDRGLALMAIGGNITTTWSWFGVNELGVGLHSYGFTEGVLWNLLLFACSQLTLIAIGLWGKPRSPEVMDSGKEEFAA